MKSNSSQLEWDAFRYVSGEMPDAERETFEMRLADEQSVREAVAAVVEFSACLAMATREAGTAPNSEALPVGEASGDINNKSQPVTRHVVNWNRRVVWISISALASLVLLFFTSGLLDRTNVAKFSPRRTRSTSELAVAWAETRSHMSRAAEAERQEFGAGTDEINDDATDDQESEPNRSIIDAPMDPPSWMVTAVENLAEQRETLPQGERVE